MTTIVMVGSGVVGMCSAMLLARDGHQITVLERDPALPPADAAAAWADWERRSVAQFRNGHLFLSRFREELSRELPEVVTALEDFGALRINTLDGLPESFTGPVLPEDRRFDVLTARRPVCEAALARVADQTAGLTIRRGVAVSGLVLADGSEHSVPRVTGVRTEEGEEVMADLVIDAGGRRSPFQRWLTEAGAAVTEDVDDLGFVYYGRHFASEDGSVPAAHGGGLTHYGSVSILSLAADNGTWSLILVASAKDKAMRALTDTTTWTNVMRQFPLTAHWLDGEPLSDKMEVMAGIADIRRHLVIDGKPAVEGVVAIGDASSATNPSVGRGASIGLLQAIALRDTLAATGSDDLHALAIAFHDACEERVSPYVQDTVVFDRTRLDIIESAMNGVDYVNDDPGYLLGQALANGVGRHPDLLRGYLEVANLLARGADVLSRPGMAELAIEHGAAAPPPGPGRHDLLELLGTS